MKAYLDLMRYALGRLGLPGQLGLAFIILALLVEALLIVPMEQETARIEADHVRKRQALRAKLRAEPVQVARPVATLSPAAESSLRKLFQAAEQEGISLDQADYKLSADPVTGRRRYQLTIPVVGPYPAVRAFVARALNDDAALALGSLDMHRETIEDADIEAVLQFTLFLDAES